MANIEKKISIDDSAKEGLTQFWEHDSLRAKIFKTLITLPLEDIKFQIENYGCLKVKDAILWFLVHNSKRKQNYVRKGSRLKNSEVG